MFFHFPLFLFPSSSSLRLRDTFEWFCSITFSLLVLIQVSLTFGAWSQYTSSSQQRSNKFKMKIDFHYASRDSLNSFSLSLPTRSYFYFFSAKKSLTLQSNCFCHNEALPIVMKTSSVVMTIGETQQLVNTCSSAKRRLENDGNFLLISILSLLLHKHTARWMSSLSSILLPGTFGGTKRTQQQ